MAVMRGLSPRGILAEEALHALLEAKLQVLSTTDAAARPRLGRRSHRTASAAAQEYAVARYLSAVEVFVDSTFETLLTVQLGKSSRIVTTVLRDMVKAASAAWSERERAYKDYFAVALNDSTDYSVIRAGVELRNSLAHNLGVLTARQRRDPTVPGKLELIDVTIHSGRMHISERTAALMYAACRSFVIWLDSVCPA